MPDIWPPLRRSNERPIGEWIGGLCLAATPIGLIIALLIHYF